MGMEQPARIVAFCRLTARHHMLSPWQSHPEQRAEGQTSCIHWLLSSIHVIIHDREEESGVL